MQRDRSVSTILPLAREMLRNEYHPLEVIKFVEKHYHQCLEASAELARQTMLSQLESETLGHIADVYRARAEELYNDIVEVGLRHGRAYDVTKPIDDLSKAAAGSPTLSKWKVVIQKHREEEKRKPATSSDGAPLRKLSSSVSLAPSLASPSPDADASKVGLQQTHEATVRELLTTRSELRKAKDMLRRSLDERSRLSKEHCSLSSQMMSFQDDISGLQEMIRRLKSESWEEKRSFENEKTVLEQRYESLKREFREHIQDASAIQENLHTTIDSLRSELSITRREAKTREAELNVVVEQSKALLRERGGSDSIEEQLIAQHLQPLREALAEANRKLSERETWGYEQKRSAQPVAECRRSGSCTPVQLPAINEVKQAQSVSMRPARVVKRNNALARFEREMRNSNTVDPVVNSLAKLFEKRSSKR